MSAIKLLKKYQIEKMKNVVLVVLSLFLIQCAVTKKHLPSKYNSSEIAVDTLVYFDASRNRQIPVAIYQPKDPDSRNGVPIIFNHGYGGNKGGDYKVYSYITEFLASKGYFVVSIQHELPTDDLLAMSGQLANTRRPNWQRGVENIHFVINKMKNDFPEFNYKKLSLIGHSNGGDMVVLFAHQYPALVEKIISMDNRRMEIPRVNHPKLFTLRSKDYPADPHVLPSEGELAKYGITVEFTKINHSDMDNDANTEEREYMNRKILEYLEK